MARRPCSVPVNCRFTGPAVGSRASHPSRSSFCDPLVTGRRAKDSYIIYRWEILVSPASHLHRRSPVLLLLPLIFPPRIREPKRWSASAQGDPRIALLAVQSASALARVAADLLPVHARGCPKSLPLPPKRLRDSPHRRPHEICGMDLTKLSPEGDL